MLERVAQRPFDGIIVADDAAAAIVGGMSLVERAAFTLVRGGAHRLLVLGVAPPARRRLPDVDVAWNAPLPQWLGDSEDRPVVIMHGTTVVDPDTVAAFAAARPDGPLTTPRGELIRPDRLATMSAVALVSGLGKHGSAGNIWTPPEAALLVRASDPSSRTLAERALYARLGRPGDGWFTRVVDRRLSRAITRVLLPTGVAPNHVTLGSIAIGILGGCCFAQGTPAVALIGALLFLTSTIVDGCDGEIARLTFRETPFGAKLDILGDNLVHLVLFGGIAVGLFRRSGDPTIAVLGWTLLAGVVVAMASVYSCIVQSPPNPAQRTLFETFASREFAYLLVLLTVLGRLDWFLWMSAVGTYVFAIGLVVLGWRRSP